MSQLRYVRLELAKEREVPNLVIRVIVFNPDWDSLCRSPGSHRGRVTEAAAQPSAATWIM
jgi:hypothetical protein